MRRPHAVDEHERELELDRETGLPATATTAPEKRYTEWFVTGTEPGAIAIDIWKRIKLGGIGR